MHEYKEFIYGLHLKGVDLSARNFPSQTNKTENKMLKNNQLPRYHFFDFEKTELGIDNLVIDFKIYYSVSVDYLVYLKNTNFVYSVPPLYREQISQRFAYYLSRIGLLE
jgi:hypothetical protein